MKGTYCNGGCEIRFKTCRSDGRSHQRFGQVASWTRDYIIRCPDGPISPNRGYKTGSGKTCITARYVDDTFYEYLRATIGSVNRLFGRPMSVASDPICRRRCPPLQCLLFYSSSRGWGHGSETSYRRHRLVLLHRCFSSVPNDLTLGNPQPGLNAIKVQMSCSTATPAAYFSSTTSAARAPLTVRNANRHPGFGCSADCRCPDRNVPARS